MDREHLVRVIRQVIEERRRLLESEEPSEMCSIPDLVMTACADLLDPSPRRVINGTGTVLHTNLGRAPVSNAAAQAIAEAVGYTALDYDRGSGRRTSRQEHVEGLLRVLVGAEAAIQVTSNAAALLLVLRCLSYRREVVISRGESVEIGEGFRIPSILRESGARLVEVGTTNRTNSGDFEAAIGPRTGAILKIQPSNFEIVGFVQTAPLKALASLASSAGIPMIVDNGSGPLIDTARFGLRHEPMPAEALAAGADVVTFSTDKLLGGPQGGVIAGRRILIDKIRRHPMTRAMRPDKIAIAALRATLQEYLRGRPEHIPVIGMLGRTTEELAVRGQQLAERLTRRGIAVDVVPSQSTVGGGSLPGQVLASLALAIAAPDGAVALASTLRGQTVPIIARVRRGALLLDLRTILPREEDALIEGLTAAFRTDHPSAPNLEGPADAGRLDSMRTRTPHG